RAGIATQTTARAGPRRRVLRGWDPPAPLFPHAAVRLASECRVDNPAGETARLLDLLRLGDEQARSRLIAHACDRLRRLTRKMLRGYPGVRRWEQTDDVVQNALIRLCRGLQAASPET